MDDYTVKIVDNKAVEIHRVFYPLPSISWMDMDDLKINNDRKMTLRLTVYHQKVLQELKEWFDLIEVPIPVMEFVWEKDHMHLTLHCGIVFLMDKDTAMAFRLKWA